MLNRTLKSKLHSKSAFTEAIPRNETISNEEEEVEIDWFDETILLDTEKDTCVMCKLGHNEGLAMLHKLKFVNDVEFDDAYGYDSDYDPNEIKESKTDPDNVWISKYSLRRTGCSGNNSKIFVHFACAFYSPRAFFDGHNWKNVRREIVRSRGLTCKLCHHKGATMGCSKKRCQYVCHITCASNQNMIPESIFKYAKFFCPEHVVERQQSLEKLDQEANLDVSIGRENIPIHVVNTMDKNAFKPIFHYISYNIDSDNVLATPQNINEIPSCNCIDLCNDINSCDCVSQQRNYANNGILIAGIVKPIFECNSRCKCNLRRCTNRVVEQGIRYPLEIFRGQLRASSTSSLTLPSWTIPKSSESTENTQTAFSADLSSARMTKIRKLNSSMSYLDRKQTKQGSYKYWGVRAKEQMGAGAFVCELKGQYVMGGSALDMTRINRRMMEKPGLRKWTRSPLNNTRIDRQMTEDQGLGNGVGYSHGSGICLPCISTNSTTRATETSLSTRHNVLVNQANFAKGETVYRRNQSQSESSTLTALPVVYSRTVSQEFLHQLISDQTFTVFPTCFWVLKQINLTSTYEYSIQLQTEIVKETSKFADEEINIQTNKSLSRFSNENDSLPFSPLLLTSTDLKSLPRAVAPKMSGLSINGMFYHSSINSSSTSPAIAALAKAPIMPSLPFLSIESVNGAGPIGLTDTGVLRVNSSIANGFRQQLSQPQLPLSEEEMLVSLEKFLDSQVFVDFRYFANIARFVRQIRPSDSNKSSNIKVTYKSSHSSSAKSIKVAGSVASLERRVVYNNRNDTRYPKLALFLMAPIEPNTEVVIKF